MKATIISLIITALFIGGSYFFTKQGGAEKRVEQENNVVIQNGTQIVTIKAKSGFTPGKSVAKAGLPTILRFETNGTFDCSSSIRIPSMNVAEYLPLSGKTDITIGIPEVSTLQGSCAMGMYPFEVEFL